MKIFLSISTKIGHLHCVSEYGNRNPPLKLLCFARLLYELKQSGFGFRVFIAIYISNTINFRKITIRDSSRLEPTILYKDA
jgi:hypothetical protein